MPARTRLIGLFFTLLLLISVFGLAAAKPGLSPKVAQAPGPGFSYQGRLEFAGVPVNGPVDFHFSLWDGATGGVQTGETQVMLGVEVVNGGFSVLLNANNEIYAGGSPFWGEALWLQIAVSPGTGIYTTLAPRQAITATPYAHSLLPGAVISGVENTQYALNVNGIYGGITSSGQALGVLGLSSASSGAGVMGGATGDQGAGVYGESLSYVGVVGDGGDTGVYGAGGEFGVQGKVNGADDIAVYGEANATGSVGVWGTSTANTGVYGSGGKWGVWGTTPNPGSIGVFGVAHAPGSVGVYGQSNDNVGVYGYGKVAGVMGVSDTSYAVSGKSNGASATAILASSPYTGLWAESYGDSALRMALVGYNFYDSSGWAGYFYGDVGATGSINYAASGFTIDHPLDPANRTLTHATVESAEMKTIYDGTIVTGADGKAVVRLPDYMQALNQDFRYQLTVIGAFARAIVLQEIKDNQFVIQTDQPNVKVSWQVTGVRRDAYTTWQPLVVEQQKSGGQRGLYWQPQVFGLPTDMGILSQPAHTTPLVDAWTGEMPPLPQTTSPSRPPQPSPAE